MSHLFLESKKHETGKLEIAEEEAPPTDPAPAKLASVANNSGQAKTEQVRQVSGGTKGSTGQDQKVSKGKIKGDSGSSKGVKKKNKLSLIDEPSVDAPISTGRRVEDGDGKRDSTSTTVSHRRDRTKQLEAEAEDAVGGDYDDDADLEQPGAFSVAGFSASGNEDNEERPSPEITTSPEETARVGAVRVNIDDNQDEEGLIKAELAPQVFDATEVKPEAEQAPTRSMSGKGKLIIVFTVVVALVIGLVIGLVSRNGKDDGEPIPAVEDTTPTDAPTTSSPPTDPSTTQPTALSATPYLEDPALQAFHKDWNCMNSTTTDDGTFFCFVEIPRGFPYFHYNSDFRCICQEPVGPDNPATNELCNCDILFRLSIDGEETQLFCNSASIVDQAILPPALFQIQYDCSNLFLKRLNDAVDQSCVGRDAQGDCFPLNAVPHPTEIVTMGNTSDLFCFPTQFSTEGGVFEILRGRYQCNSPAGIPFPQAITIRTVLFCKEPGYQDFEEFCNCAVFLGELDFGVSCQDCQVIPNGSNDTFQIAYDCSDRFIGDCVGVSADGTCIDSDSVTSICTFYDIASCQEHALKVGLLLGGAGFPFAGPYNTKGCYYYESDHPQFANRAYFGTGGTTISQLESIPNQGNLRMTCDVTSVADPPTQNACPIFDAKACEEAALAQGLALGKGGWPFETNAFGTKGCFYFPPTADESVSNAAFFGTGATFQTEMLTIPTDGSLRFFCDVTTATNP